MGQALLSHTLSHPGGLHTQGRNLAPAPADWNSGHLERGEWCRDTELNFLYRTVRPRASRASIHHSAPQKLPENVSMEFPTYVSLFETFICAALVTHLWIQISLIYHIPRSAFQCC